VQGWRREIADCFDPVLLDLDEVFGDLQFQRIALERAMEDETEQLLAQADKLASTF
jgi:hypothetical protein